MKTSMDKNIKIGLILIILVGVALLSTIWFFSIESKVMLWEPRRFLHGRIREDIEMFYMIKTIISSVNIVIILILLVLYANIYAKTKSNFTIWLMIFSLILLFYAFSSNPIVHWIFGFHAFGLGPFAMLPDLFTCIALLILLYLTVNY